MLLQHTLCGAAFENNTQTVVGSKCSDQYANETNGCGSITPVLWFPYLFPSPAQSDGFNLENSTLLSLCTK